VTTFVLDSSAMLRLLDKEAGWERVAAILASHAGGDCGIEISAIQWGEIGGRVRKRAGAPEEARVIRKLNDLHLRIVDATGERVLRAAALKVDRGVPYADAFALDLAMDSADRVLVTADFDFKKAADLAKIEFLPAK
jgi:predicted nucleic acid-binding protein